MSERSPIARRVLLESVAAEHFQRFMAGADECLERSVVLRAAARLPERKALMLLRLAQCNAGNPRIRQLCSAL